MLIILSCLCLCYTVDTLLSICLSMVTKMLVIFVTSRKLLLMMTTILISLVMRPRRRRRQQKRERHLKHLQRRKRVSFPGKYMVLCWYLVLTFFMILDPEQLVLFFAHQKLVCFIFCYGVISWRKYFIFIGGKSSVLLDVKPWDDETDMKKLEEAVRSVEMPGLLWGAGMLPSYFELCILLLGFVIKL